MVMTPEKAVLSAGNSFSDICDNFSATIQKEVVKRASNRRFDQKVVQKICGHGLHV
jgi:selenophosphate synthase